MIESNEWFKRFMGGYNSKKELYLWLGLSAAWVVLAVCCMG